jgi:hypothetical protein
VNRSETLRNPSRNGDKSKIRNSMAADEWTPVKPEDAQTKQLADGTIQATVKLPTGADSEWQRLFATAQIPGGYPIPKGADSAISFTVGQAQFDAYLSVLRDAIVETNERYAAEVLPAQAHEKAQGQDRARRDADLRETLLKVLRGE